MCKPHWNEYTSALRKAALARKAASEDETPAKVAPAEPKPTPKRANRAPKAIAPEADAQVDAG